MRQLLICCYYGTIFLFYMEKSSYYVKDVDLHHYIQVLAFLMSFHL